MVIHWRWSRTASSWISPSSLCSRTMLYPFFYFCSAEGGAQSTMHTAQLFFQWASHIDLKLFLLSECGVCQYCMCVNMFGHATVHTYRGQRPIWKTQFFPSTRWAPGIDPGWSDLAAGAFTLWAIAPASLCLVFIWPHVCESQFSSPELQSKTGTTRKQKDSQYSPQI